MSDAVGPTRGGFLVGVVGASLFVASIAQKAVSIVDLYDLAQMVYVAAAALVVAAIGGWTIYDAWSPAEQRRVLVWTLLGGSFLLVLALLATVDLQLGDAVGVVDREFFLLHFVTLGCLGGSTVGLYAVRTGQSTRRAAAERNRSEAVVRQSPLPITVVDMDGTVIRWNEAAEDVFGYDADEVRGEPSPLVPADGKAEYREHLDRLRGGDDIEGVRTKRQCRDGTLLDVELWGTPVSDPASGEIYAVFLARDLTEIDLLEERRTVLERVLRHNLRNELTVIRGQADHVASAGDGDRADAAETIVAAADRLIALSEHVGRLHRLDETIASRDVSDCVARVVEQAREEYPAATVVVDAPASARVQAVALLEDAIREAVENAIVHADDPEPTVSVTVSDGAETGYVRVSIADTGPGIPDREWEPVESGAERALAHGSGLGLWVMQWAASRSGGRLSRTDREPTGTTVIFELPKTTDPSGTRPAAVAALSRATSAAPPRETATGDGAAGDGRQDRPT